MILQTLAQYYERKNESEPGLLPQFGFGIQPISVVIEIDRDGQEIQMLIRDSKNGDAQEFVPAAVKRSSGVAANLLWDTAEYCLGIDTKGKPQRVVKQHKAFRDRIEELDCHDEGVEALKRYLVSVKRSPSIEQHNDHLMTNPNVSFRLLGDAHLICQREKVIESIRKDRTPNPDAESLCLVSGCREPVERLHPAIKGVWGAQSSGANIVSFNQDAFDSYGKSQGYNCPVGEKAAFLYTTSLNYLLRKGSEQRMQVGDASTVFWSEKESSLEKNMGCIFGSTLKQVKDDPDRYSGAVKAVYDSVHRGHHQGGDAYTKFYVLGLSPNASRIAIRFWHVATVGEISARIKQHFDDLCIVRAQHEQEYLPLFLLLISISVQNKSENIPPNLAGELMKSILEGAPYPYALLAAAVRR
ncbi:MAG: type I-C CRISPR-associated protein Cas8c/Csd1, partial [Gammaproteobacteria bacterium]|nr:type I-C CRISPR-associated protein Cas8c/Csd1 [Gammaproteobacteria bacterium]